MSAKKTLVARLRQQIAVQDELISQLRQLLAAQDKQIAALESRQLELERRLGLDSTTSSKPPSSDGLRKKPAPQSLRTPGQRPSGGQKGHRGTTLRFAAQPDDVFTHTVDTCENCGKTLRDIEPMRILKRQVFDVASPATQVAQHNAQVKQCSCGHITQGVFPKHVTAPVQYGQRLKSMAVYFLHQQLIPEDRLQQMFADLFGLSVASATLTKAGADFAREVHQQQQQVLTQLKAAETKHLDETGFRVAGRTQWLHVISTPLATYYRCGPKRGEMWDGVQGIVTHDHWKPYFTMKGVQHALCNAHHLRELQALEKIEQEPWAFRMSRLLRGLHRRLDKPPDWEWVSRLYDRIVQKGLEFHESQPLLSSRKNKRRVGHNLVLRLRNFKEEVLRFITNPSVAFTNNQAEQDIRMMKVKQKISGGFRTTAAAQDFCVIRGFLSTKRKQKINLWQAIQAAWG